MNIFTNLFRGKKVVPKRNGRLSLILDEQEEYEEMEPRFPFYVVRVQALLKMYGGQRHPMVDSYQILKKKGELLLWKYVPPGSTTIYVSTQCKDTDGTHMYHLLLMLERLRDREIAKVEMDAYQSILYSQVHTTFGHEWAKLISSTNTFVFLEQMCVPLEKLEEAYRSIPRYIQCCDFMIILAPTMAAMMSSNAEQKNRSRVFRCYRTYRLQAKCVLEMFSSFLRIEDTSRPMLLIRSGTGTPLWVSAYECHKLGVGRSKFQCCETNHILITTCRRGAAWKCLQHLVTNRSKSLFHSGEFGEARFTISFESYWTRGLKDSTKMISLSTFKKKLRWNDMYDNSVVDREGYPLLAYAVANNTVRVVKEILQSSLVDVNARIPKHGIPNLSIPGRMTPLMGAMAVSSTEIVSLLLEHGASPTLTDSNGNDAFMYASIFEHYENTEAWLTTLFPDWNLDRRETLMGGSALTHALYFGRSFKYISLLLRHGANPDIVTYTGSSLLTTICSNEDCNPNVLRKLFSFPSVALNINRQLSGGSLKWRLIQRSTRFLYVINWSKSKLVENLALDSGATALHYAVRRGDIETVQVLLHNGADPTVSDSLGHRPEYYCSEFVELHGALKKVSHTKTKNRNTRGTLRLERHVSTASDLRFPMFLIPLGQLHSRYGGEEPRYHRIEAHQVLKERRELVRWINLPFDAHVVFFSHEWVGWNHPDPNGVQLHTFLEVMKRLAIGEIGTVDMNAFHSILYKDTYSTSSEEWKYILSAAYVWIDWASMPQPSACSPSVPKKEKDKMGTDLGNAVKSIPAYVEKADFVVIVAPGCLHADRRDPKTKLRTKTCYRTYRSRGWCVLEMFASFLSRFKTHPILLITSKCGQPEWVSSLECQKLAVGTSDFTCCQRNHIFGDRVVPCDRGITRTILDKLITSKAKQMFNDNEIVGARLCVCLANWWIRTESVLKEHLSSSLENFKRIISWDDQIDGELVDRKNVPILFYAAIRNDVKIALFMKECNRLDRLCLNVPALEDGDVRFGIPKRVYILNAAMAYANVKFVQVLLECGADPYVTDMNGADSLHFASTLGRAENVEYWVSHFSGGRWDVNRGLDLNGATALHCAVYFGRNKLRTVRVLVEIGGASLDVLNDGGASILHNAVNSQDSNVDIVKYLLKTKTLRYGINHRRRAVKLKWKSIYTIARVCVRTGISRSGVLWDFADDSGSTPLHEAAKRGDLETIELLMEHGADPSIKNDLNRDVCSYCDAFPEVSDAIKRLNSKERDSSHHHQMSSMNSPSETHVTDSTFTLQRRQSTSTSSLYPMYLLKASTMLKMFGDDESRKRNISICHQDLLQNGEITRFEDLPMSSFVIFVSHQWSSSRHPDPHGRQIQVLCTVLRKLREGVFERVDTDPFHTLVFKENVTTKHSEWKRLISNAFVWFDFWSQPQPTMTKEASELARVESDLNLAIESTASYVERSDTLVILVPVTVHLDRIDAYTGRREFLCYRTWRKRGLCVLELFCSFLSRRKTHPTLLVRSDVETPTWISSHECLRLSIGECDFTCCEMNHLRHDGQKPIRCVRPIAQNVVESLIQSKIKDRMKHGSIVHARWLRVMKHFWCRGLGDTTTKATTTTTTETKKDKKPPTPANDETLVSNARKSLYWDQNLENEWVDRENVSFLGYAACWDRIHLVRAVLNMMDPKTSLAIINSQISHFSYVGIPAGCTPLIGAMTLGSTNVVKALLEKGADPYVVTKAGNDPLMCACIAGRLKNVTFFMNYFYGKWNINRRNKLGGNSLGCTVYMGGGKDRLKLVKFLINQGADVDSVTDNGTSNIISACANEDASIDVLQTLIDESSNPDMINLQIRPRTITWKIIYSIANMLVKTGINHSSLLQSLSARRGRTALHYAAKRGDLSIVELLLSAGANPLTKDKCGLSVKDVCSNFPELQGMLIKRQRKQKFKRFHGRKRTMHVEHLRKRLSTATIIEHDMFLISLDTLTALYGQQGKSRVMDVHQELKKRHFLTNWRDVPSGSEIIFVSHEWLSWAHPDPKGKQLRVLCRVLERLKKGELSQLMMDFLDTTMYQMKFTTSGKELQEMLNRSYLWIDWISMPQSIAENEDEIGTKKMNKIRSEGSKAIRSIPAYVERSDFMIILAPGYFHTDRKIPTCYRSWRRRGWCLLELFASFMARDSSHPSLVIKSLKGVPTWTSPFQVHLLSIGHADFTCCQRNHILTTATQKSTSKNNNNNKISCDKSIAKGIMKTLIRAKVKHILSSVHGVAAARWFICLETWWTRGDMGEDDTIQSLTEFKNLLKWDPIRDGEFFDRDDASILTYAIVKNKLKVVREILNYALSSSFKDLKRLISDRIKEMRSIGIPGNCTPLNLAMMMASPDIVQAILKAGADPYVLYSKVNMDSVMLASLYGRAENVELWLNTFSDWNVKDRVLTFNGANALNLTARIGQSNHKVFDLLTSRGVPILKLNYLGHTVLMSAVENEDCDPLIVRSCLTLAKKVHKNEIEFKDFLNARLLPQTLLYKAIFMISKSLVRMGSKSLQVQAFAQKSGTTALILAVMRGDAEIVKLLLDNGADPYIENDLGMNAFTACKAFGPFPSVRKVLLESELKDENSTAGDFVCVVD